MDCSIIGVSIRVEGCDSNYKFWETLVEEGSFMKPMSKERWELLQEETDKKWGGREDILGMYLEDIDSFDSSLFKLSGGVSKFMDPRQRLLLEACWGAVEDAGIKMSHLKGKRVGVFMAHDSFDFGCYYRKVAKDDLDYQDFIIPGNVSSFLANRISYLLDLKGPSMAINSTCSSIYVALHHAKIALEKGECDYAIVGGVSLFLEPWKKGAVTPTAFESKENEINSFSNEASGYHSSEGCGALLLQRDTNETTQKHDSYAIIKSTGYNSGGKTNSFAQPSQKQQTLLFKEVLDAGQLKASDIEYIEAHGISSLIGDAIEANAIIDVFKGNEQPCYVSTIKPNIGHTHAASGLYSLMKAILAIKYKYIPAIKGLKEKSLNEDIQKETQGITFLSEGASWETSTKKNVLLTSYGFSNVNAAVLLSEPINKEVKASDYKIGDQAVICLSANSKVQVYQQIEHLLNFIEEQKVIEKKESIEPLDCHQIAYTLQTGREAMPYRWVAIVASVAELMTSLISALATKGTSNKNAEITTLWGDPKENKATLVELKSNPEKLDEKLVKLLKLSNYKELATYWVKGVDIKWEYCYKGKSLKSMRLPIYPFAKKTFWIPKEEKKEQVTGAKLHPLLHVNSSNLEQQKFTTLFTGEEDFLVDHVVGGTKIFPGAAYLELIRAAAERSLPEAVTQIQDVIWLTPKWAKGTPKEMYTSLIPREDDIRYEVYSLENTEKILHSQGSITTQKIASTNKKYDIEALKKRMPNKITGDSWYRRMANLDLVLGKCYTGVDMFYHNDTEVMTRINFPKEDEYVLSVGIMDSALQTCVGWLLEKENYIALPFGVKEVTIYKEIPEGTLWGYAQKSQNNKENSQIINYDIDLLDNDGAVIISFKEFVIRSFNGVEIQQEKEKVTLNHSHTNTNNQNREYIQYITTLISKELKVSENELELSAPFESYGIDSVLINRLTNRLEDSFGRLSRTLFFEYQTLRELIDYFIEKHSERLNELVVKKESIIGVNNTADSVNDNINDTNGSRFVASKGVKELEAKDVSESDIAIIGLSGRYPGARTINDFWENLKQGKDCITEIPSDRWDVDAMFNPEKGVSGKSYSKWGGFIDDIDKFDSLFFNISPKEAELMDPQERLFLQTVWESIEDAGYTKSQLVGNSRDSKSFGNKIGIYIGVMFQDYSLLGVDQGANGFAVPDGIAANVANRVSSFFNFQGPSMALDTMCSSSLTAIHLACQGLLTGDAQVAVAGGVNISSHPNKYVMLCQKQFLSSRGKCESFGVDGNGYVPGEGVGAILLKPLDKAKADGDRIYGVIKGTSINHGGKTNGYTVPNPNAQSNVIQEAIKSAGVKAEDFSYIEAHGTGTPLGDPIEITGLIKAFQTEKAQYCSIGSVKSNIGHCESAAGISGVTKILLQLQNKTLVPSLHSSTLNPHIDFETTPFKVQQELEEWTTIDNKPRLAGVSSFGAGGSNAHVIIEEYVPEDKPLYKSDVPAIILLSGTDKKNLREVVFNLQNYLSTNKDKNIYDVAYTLQIGREPMDERLALVCSDIESLLSELNNYYNNQPGDFYQGNTENDKNDFFLSGNAGKSYIKTAIEDKEITSLAQLWVKGIQADWRLLYKDGIVPQKISLPTYPFAKERHWISNNDETELPIEKRHLHPLLHLNTSNLKEQRFTTVFTGKESFLVDHKVRKEKVLPGVGYLEMARAAGSISLEAPITQIKDITWLKPVSVNGKPKEVHVSLFEKNGLINYDIFSVQGDSEIIHGQGQLLSEALLTSSDLSIDLEALRSRLLNKKQGSECYEFFQELGLEYGHSFQGIESLYYSASESLSKINLVKESGYILQPGLLDSALQTCLALSMEGSTNSLNLPFSAEEVNIYGDVDETVWCYARKSIKNKDNKIQSYDIDMLSSSGTVLLSFKEFFILPIGGLQQGEEKTLFNSETKTTKSISPNAGNNTYELLVQLIKETFAALVKIEVSQLRLDKDFTDYGADSIVFTQLTNKLKTELDISFSLTVLFDYNTVDALAGFILENHQPKFKLQENTMLSNEEVYTERRRERGKYQSKVSEEVYKAQYSLSEGQKGLWYIHTAEPNSTAYNIPVPLMVEATIATDNIYKAATQLIHEYPMLRTTINVDEDTEEPFQTVQSAVNYLKKDVEEIAYKEDIDQILKGLLHTSFDISREMTRLHVREDKVTHKKYVLFVIHHMVFDGFSASSFIGRFKELLNQFTIGKIPISKPEDTSYFDFIDWEKNYVTSKKGAEDLAYWKNKFSSSISKIELPYDKIIKRNTNIQRTEGCQTIEFTGEELRLLKETAKSLKVNLSMFLLSIFKTLLYRLSNSEEITITMPTLGRPNAKYEKGVGFYVNMLLSRSFVSGDLKFSEFLKTVQSEFLLDIDHLQYPFSKMVSELSLTKGDENDLLPVSFIYQNIFEEIHSTDSNDTIHMLDTIHQGITNDYTMEIIDLKDKVTIKQKYRKDLFSDKTIANHLVYFNTIIKTVEANHSIELDAIEILPEQERQQLLVTFNNSSIDYAKSNSIHELFEAQVAKTPEALAISFQNKRFSYKELNESANVVAHYLLANHNLNKGTFVGICLERSPEMIIAILGILKAGGAYLPLDPNYPESRLNYMIEDAGLDIVISEPQLSKRLNLKTTNFVPISQIIGNKNADTVKNVSSKLVSMHPDDSSYIIYTSGSTGKPKASVSHHKGLVNLSQAQKDQFNITAASRVLQFASFSFDVCTYEWVMALSNGASLWLVPIETIKSSIALSNFVEANQITHATLPPAVVPTLTISQWKSVKYMSVAGDSCSLDLAKKWSVNRNFYNAYGPSEATVIASTYKFEGKENNVPIGKPLPNVQVYVLNSQQQVQPIGIAGELYIGGVGVAKGYINRPELTAERFIQNPFSDKPDERLYRTGDLVKWQHDGNLVFLGRIDQQVKIRGFRIELGEIESVLNEMSEIKDSVVVVKEHAGNKNLVAYYICKNQNIEIKKEALRSHLSKTLPDHMIPSFMVAIAAFPLTNNGKINRKELSEKAIENLKTNTYSASMTALEKKLENLWMEILQLENIGIHSDFFDIGGHSISATRLVAKVRKHLSVEITIKDIFENRTISHLAKYITNHSKVALPEIEVYSGELPIPSSIGQERLWFLDKLKGSVEYHIPVFLRLEGVLDQKLLEKALRLTISRQKTLRSVFKSISGSVYQEVLSADDWSLKSSKVEDASKLDQQLYDFLIIPFDLSKDYMLRSHLYAMKDGTFMLANIFHHIATDGWSMDIWFKEFASIYNTLKQNQEVVLSPLSIQYTDYAIWQRQYITDAFLEEQLSYWRTQLEEVSPLLLPTDYARPVMQDVKGDRLYFHFDNAFKQSLLRLSKKENVTLFMLLLSAFKIVLSRYSGQDNIAVGSPVANRTQEELKDVIGLFINTLILRSDISGTLSFTEFLQEIKKTTLEAYDHQSIPFEKIVDNLVVDRDISTSPLFQVMFVLQNTSEVGGAIEDTELDGLTMTIPPYMEGGTSKYDLTFRLTESESGITLEIEYATALFKAERIHKMAGHYEQLLKSIIHNPEDRIDDLVMLDQKEITQVLDSFNDTAVSYSQEKTLVDLIIDQVKRTKNGVALAFEDEEMTYEELDKRSNQLAHYLRKKGAKAEIMVGICIDRSFEMMVGILGILKSGAAYVPIDPEYPQERIGYIIEDAKLDIVLCKKAEVEVLQKHKVLQIVRLDTDWAAIAKESDKTLKRNHTATNLAYVIYTSGSTGRPKGVMNEHGGIVNRLLWAQDHYKLDPNQDVILQKTTFCFDVSVWELFWPLITGVKLVFAKPNGHKDPMYLKRLIEKQQITTMHFVPSMLGVFLNSIKISDCASLKNVLCSGEALKLDQILLFKQKFPNVRLDNLYGPTEAAIDVSSWEVPYEIENLETVLIGKPVANTKLYVLSSSQRMVPIGATGELYIGGDQVARGYLNRDKLTQEKFIPDPFSTKKGAKLYRTGDFAKWTANGNIDFLGRMDNQVKIRGYRIELGEIENALSKFDKINKVSVIVNNQGNEPQLVAFYESSDKESLIDEMRYFLEKQLPAYMVPSLFIPLENFPLTSSGKTDSKKLGNIDIGSIHSNGFSEPRTETEKKVAEIWRAVLSVKKIGLNDRFFERGGSSLSLVGVRDLIEKHFGIPITLMELIQYPKVSTLAFFIDQKQKGEPLNKEIKRKTRRKDKLQERRNKRKPVN